VFAHFAATVSGGGDAGVGVVLWVGAGLAVAGGVTAVALYAAGGARAQAPDLGRFLEGAGAAWYSPPLLARIRHLPPTAPAVDEDSAGPTVDEDSAGPTVDEDSAGPTVAEDSAGPTVAEDSAGPTVAEDSARPTVDEDSAGPTVATNGRRPSPAQDSDRPPAVDDRDSPSVVEDGART
jgi:hypothetical protein